MALIIELSVCGRCSNNSFLILSSLSTSLVSELRSVSDVKTSDNDIPRWPPGSTSDSPEYKITTSSLETWTHCHWEVEPGEGLEVRLGLMHFEGHLTAIFGR